MKTIYYILFIVASLICFSAKAQQKAKFNSKNSVGISIGQNGSSLLFQTVNGVSFNNWFYGIGIGADYYNYNSYPLFADIRRYFGKNGKGFVYGDLGYNFSGNNKPGKEVYYYQSYKFSGGVYTDLGIGYKMKFIRKSFFTVSAGFNYKEINNKVSAGIIPCYNAPCPVDYSNYKYGNGKVVLKAGVDF